MPASAKKLACLTRPEHLQVILFLLHLCRVRQLWGQAHVLQKETADKELRMRLLKTNLA